MCNMDCKNCKLPVEKCHGGDSSRAFSNRANAVVKPGQPIKMVTGGRMASMKGAGK